MKSSTTQYYSYNISRLQSNIVDQFIFFKSAISFLKFKRQAWSISSSHKLHVISSALWVPPRYQLSCFHSISTAFMYPFLSSVFWPIVTSSPFFVRNQLLLICRFRSHQVVLHLPRILGPNPQGGRPLQLCRTWWWGCGGWRWSRA